MKNNIRLLFLFVLGSFIVGQQEDALALSSKGEYLKLASIESKSLKPSEIAALNNLTVPFIPNHHQLNQEVAYYAKVSDGTVFVNKSGEIVYSLRQDTPTVLDRKNLQHLPQYPKNTLQQPVVFSERFLNSQKQTITPGMESETTVSIFHGNDQTKWENELPTYADVSLGKIYPGIELRLSAHSRSVEKLFAVDPSANPENIEIQIPVAEKLSLTSEGQLLVGTKTGEAQFSRPIAWQNIDGKRIGVDIAYSLDNHNNTYGFQIGGYNTHHPLFIDPLLQSTLLGGNSNDRVQDIAIAPNGDIYVGGWTASDPFPLCSGTYCAYGADTTFQGDDELFVARISPDLKRLIQTTYLGGTCTNSQWYAETFDGIAIAANGDVFVTGSTCADDFPEIAGGADSIRGGDDGFVTKFSSDLRTLSQSTFVGGSNGDYPHDIAIYDSTQIVVAGLTASLDFPVCAPTLSCWPAGRGDSDFAGSNEAFVAILSTDLKSMPYTTFLGGSANEYANSVLVANGSIYVTGNTGSSDFPGISGGFDVTLQGSEAFVTQLSSTLSISQSSFFGGSGSEESRAIAKGADGSIYIAGVTTSSDIPHCASVLCPSRADKTQNEAEGFVVHCSSDLKNLYNSTYLGGSSADYINDLDVLPDPENSWHPDIVYVVGETTSNDFPGVGKGTDRIYSGFNEGFAVRLNSSLSEIQQGSYLGGNGSDVANSIAVAANGEIYIAGETSSANFPGIAGGFDTTLSGYYDAFITRFSDLRGGSYYVIPHSDGKASVIFLQ
jgi:hypothetical protein